MYGECCTDNDNDNYNDNDTNRLDWIGLDSPRRGGKFRRNSRLKRDECCQRMNELIELMGGTVLYSMVGFALVSFRHLMVWLKAMRLGSKRRSNI